MSQAETRQAGTFDAPQVAREITVDYELHCEHIDDPDPAWLEGRLADELKAAYAAGQAAPQSGLDSTTEFILRVFLFEGHGHGGVSQYADDGELQCKKCRHWDYRREPLTILVEQARVAALQVGLEQAAAPATAAQHGLSELAGWVGRCMCGADLETEGDYVDHLLQVIQTTSPATAQLGEKQLIEALAEVGVHIGPLVANAVVGTLNALLGSQPASRCTCEYRLGFVDCPVHGAGSQPAGKEK